MLFFTIAAMFGFTLYSAWWLARPSTTRGQAIVFVAVLATVVITTVVWLQFQPTVLQTWFVTIRGLIDRTGQGTLARYFLGFILGIASAYAIAQEPRPVSPPPAAAVPSPPVLTPAGLVYFVPAATQTAPTEPVHSSRSGTWLTVALAITLLAVFSPHLDRWFRHLTSLKTSVIEIQLANISAAAKAVQPDARESYVDKQMLLYLANYDHTIEQDIAFINLFALPNVERQLQQHPTLAFALNEDKTTLQKQRDQLLTIQPIFSTIGSPLAKCVMKAIENGLDIDSFRQQFRPAADLLGKIIILEPEETKSASLSGDLLTIRQNFWDKIGEMSNTILPYLDKTVDQELALTCRNIKQVQTVTKPLRVTDYQTLPHLYAARSFVLWFFNSDVLALKNLQDAAGNWKFADFYTPFVTAVLMYNQGDDVEHFFDILEKMRLTAHHALEVIHEVSGMCKPNCSTDIREWRRMLTKRAKRAEFIAMNLSAYAAAEDLAQGLKSAERFQPMAERYAKQLRDAADDPQNSNDRNGLLDTAAFVTIVTEAKKADRNLEKVREAVRDLKLVVANETQRLASLPVRRRADYASLKEFRAHLASAQGLLEE